MAYYINYSNLIILTMKRLRGILLLALFTLLSTVQTPAQTHSLMSVIKEHEDLSIFAEALESHGMDKKLGENGPYTVFAPSNSVLKKEISANNISSGSVRNLLMNHIITGYASERNMKLMSKAKTLGGITLILDTSDEDITVNDVTLSSINIKANNGILHIINGVLK